MSARTFIVGGLALGLVLGVLVVIVARDTSGQIDEAAKTALIDTCRRGNVSRAWVRRFDVTLTPPPKDYMPGVAQALFPILDCTQTAGGAAVALPPDEERRYIAIVVRECRLPIVESGRVIGSRRIPGRRQGSCPGN